MATFHILKCITIILLNRDFAKHLFHEQKCREAKMCVSMCVGRKFGGRRVCRDGSRIPGPSRSSLCPSRDLPELLCRHVFVQL